MWCSCWPPIPKISFSSRVIFPLLGLECAKGKTSNPQSMITHHPPFLVGHTDHKLPPKWPSFNGVAYHGCAVKVWPQKTGVLSSAPSICWVEQPRDCPLDRWSKRPALWPVAVVQKHPPTLVDLWGYHHWNDFTKKGQRLVRLVSQELVPLYLYLLPWSCSTKNHVGICHPMLGFLQWRGDTRRHVSHDQQNDLGNKNRVHTSGSKS
jgi:hypothetical protein